MAVGGGAAATTVKPVAALGLGAVLLVGVGAASAVALSGAAAIWVGTMAFAAWRRSRPTHARRPNPVAATPSSGPPSGPPARPAMASGGDPILSELFMGLAAQVARLEEMVQGAPAATGRPGPSSEAPSAPPVREDQLVQAVEALQQGQRALLARIEADADAAERRSTMQAGAIAESVVPRLAGMDAEIARLRAGAAESDARFHDFGGQVLAVLRARDGEKVLRHLDAEAADLFDRLFYCEESAYPTAADWRADYAEWRICIKKFWDIVRGYKTAVDQPFAVDDEEIHRAGGIPDKPLFSTQDMQVRFKMLVVVNERHLKFRQDAFRFNARLGTLPELDAPVLAET